MKNTKKSDKKELFYCDILVWVTFVLMLFVRVLTTLNFHRSSEISGTEIQQVIQTFEANPIAQMIFQMEGVSYILQFIIIPASFMAIYYYMRKKVLQGKTTIESLSLFSSFGFFAMIMNIFNDLGAFLGLMFL